jgi:hypothetical protein
MAKLRKQRRAARKAQAELIGAAWLLTPSARGEAILFALVALIVSALLHFSSDKFADPDAFYHFRHAALYGEGNLFSPAFPWIPFSVIAKYSADIWYGFHVLLIPFTWIGDPVLAMRLAGVVLTWSFLLTIYCACAKLELKPAWLWPFALLVSSAFLLHRVTMLRPQVLSLGLTVLLLAQIVVGNLRGVFIIAFAIAWVHLSLFFAPLFLLGLFLAIKIFTDRKLCWQEFVAGCAGLVAGWLLRPNPLGAASIAYVQVVDLTLANLAHAPLEFGSELRPLVLAYYSNYLPFILLWLASLLFLLWRAIGKRSQFALSMKTALLLSAMLSAVFFLVALLFARRGFDFCSAFGVLVLALAVGEIMPGKKWPRLAVVGLFSVLAVYGVTQRHRVVALGWDVNQAEPAARWLHANSNPGDVVFNFRWSYFPELFFWNTKNVYTSGMDPIFQYAFDPQLYLSGLKIAAQRPSLLCPTGVCADPASVDTIKLLKERYRARYVYLLKEFDANAYFHFLSDPRFALRYEDRGAAVFEAL